LKQAIEERWTRHLDTSSLLDRPAGAVDVTLARASAIPWPSAIL